MPFTLFRQTWIQGGKKEPRYLNMYARAIDGMVAKLLKRSNTSNMWFLTDLISEDRPKLKMDHLACFVPGMLALGAYHSCVEWSVCCCLYILLIFMCVLLRDGTILEAHKWEHLTFAKALMYTCFQMYDSFPTGLSPEFVEFPGQGDMTTNKKVSVCRILPAPRASVLSAEVM